MLLCALPLSHQLGCSHHLQAAILQQDHSCRTPSPIQINNFSYLTIGIQNPNLANSSLQLSSFGLSFSLPLSLSPSLYSPPVSLPLFSLFSRRLSATASLSAPFMLRIERVSEVGTPIAAKDATHFSLPSRVLLRPVALSTAMVGAWTNSNPISAEAPPTVPDSSRHGIA